VREPGAGDFLWRRQHLQVKGIASSPDKLRNHRFCDLPIYPLTKLSVTGIIGIEASEVLCGGGYLWSITE